MKKLSLFLICSITIIYAQAQHFELNPTHACDNVTVDFTNLHPNNGYSPVFLITTGFTYSWDFGNGVTSTAMNPEAVTYAGPGVYEVSYVVNIDTIGYKITGVSLAGHLACDDSTPFDNTVEIYIKILDNSGNVLYTTIDQTQDVSEGSYVTINLPINEFNIGTNFPIWIQIWDKDSLDADDNCLDDGEGNTTQLTIPLPPYNSNGFGAYQSIINTTTAAGALQITVDFYKPVLTFSQNETVTVYQSPSAPALNPNQINICPGQPMPEITAQGTQITWYSDEQLTNQIHSGSSYTPTFSEPGSYTIFATQTSPVSSCTSVPTILNIEIEYIEGPEVASHPDFFCANEANPLLTAQGNNIRWYSDENLMNLLSETNSISLATTAPGNYTYYVTQTNEDMSCTSLAVPVNFGIVQNAAADIEITPASCYESADGQAIATITSGNAPYQYMWSNGAVGNSVSGLPRGEYTLSVIDGYFCVSTFDVLIDAPAALAVNHQILSGLCYTDEAGEIEVYVSGGVEPYSYEWSNGATESIAGNLNPGTHTVSITDVNNCNITYSIELQSPLEIGIESTLHKTSCPDLSDGSISLNITGGEPPYAFEWSNGSYEYFIENVSAGNYMVTITDFYNCTLTQSISLSSIYSTCIVPANVFTPNNDGKNDTWQIKFIELHPNALVQVFDRAGRMVFESNDYSNNFDGTLNGKNLPTGSYFYVIDLMDGSEVLRGFVDIVR